MPSNRGHNSLQTLYLPNTSRNRSNASPLIPPSQIKNRYTPLRNIEDVTEQDGISTNDNTQDTQVSPKIPPIFVYNI